jgi:hypothetical protein
VTVTAPHAAIPPAMKDPMVVDMVGAVRLSVAIEGGCEGGVLCAGTGARGRDLDNKEWRVQQYGLHTTRSVVGRSGQIMRLDEAEVMQVSQRRCRDGASSSDACCASIPHRSTVGFDILTLARAASSSHAKSPVAGAQYHKPTFDTTALWTRALARSVRP